MWNWLHRLETDRPRRFLHRRLQTGTLPGVQKVGYCKVLSWRRHQAWAQLKEVTLEIEKMTEKKITLIFGKRGSGKSYLANTLVESEQRLVIFDTLSEYTEGVVFEDKEKFIEFWRKIYQHPYRLIYRPLKPDAEIEDIAESIYLLGNVCFLVEEIDCYCTAYQISESFSHVVQRGRHKNISLIGITQRPYGIHRLLTSQAKEIYIFNTNEPRDRDYLRTLLGQDIDSKLDQLKQYEYVKWLDGKEGLEIGKA